MDEDYLMIPVTLKLKDIAPIYFPLITEIFQRGLDEDTIFPAVFNYHETDKETKDTTLKISFVVTKNAQGLTIKKVRGKARKRILAELEDLKVAKRKTKRKKAQPYGKKQK